MRPADFPGNYLGPPNLSVGMSISGPRPAPRASSRIGEICEGDHVAVMGCLMAPENCNPEAHPEHVDIAETWDDLGGIE